MRATYAKCIMVDGEDVSDGLHMVVTPETTGEVAALDGLVARGASLKIMKEPSPAQIRATKHFHDREWELHRYRVFVPRGRTASSEKTVSVGSAKRVGGQGRS